MIYDLAIIIPARCEEWVANTVSDILSHSKEKTEVIVILDGGWADPPIPYDERVTVIYHSYSVGQRAATNEGVRLTKAKYVAKCDAHCSFADYFDTTLLNHIQDHQAIVPMMKNLHVFNWVCPSCDYASYQHRLPKNCGNCGNTVGFFKEIVWKAKDSPKAMSYCFDAEPHFQYFSEFNKRPEGKSDITQTMSLQGSFFMLTRQLYNELNICDEYFGGWGSQGIEVACKMWLSGREVVCDHNTWYAHMFRTFGFPWPNDDKQVQLAKVKVRDLFFNNKWPLQTRKLSWLVKKFWPVKGWKDEDLEKLIASENMQDS